MKPFTSYRDRLCSIALRFKSFLAYNFGRRDSPGKAINSDTETCRGVRIRTGWSLIMDMNLIALNMYLNELGVPLVIDTITDRKRVQKAVYLGQAIGAELNYEFNWYVHGPYSTDLTRDYYKLAGALLAGELPTGGNTQSPGEPQLKESVREKLKALAPVIQKPDNFPLEQADWMELVSSLHYLRTVDKLDPSEARRVISTQKPHLLEYVDQAETKLKEVKLLS